MKLERYLVYFYPQIWRRRYEEELLAYLEQRPLSFLDALNLLSGAFDAHLHPQLGTASLPWDEKISAMLHILRRSLLMIFSAYAGFVLAGLAFQKLSESDTFVEATHRYSPIGISFATVVIGSVVALLGILTGGLPIVATIIRHAITQKRPGQLFLLAMPLLACMAFLGVLCFLKNIPVLFPLPSSSILLRSAFIAALLITAIISTGAVCFTIARCDQIAERSLRFALLFAQFAIVAMVLMLAATIVWGLGLWSNMPQFFMSNEGIFGSSTTLTWIGIIAAMTGTTALAIIALMQGLSACNALSAAIE